MYRYIQYKKGLNARWQAVAASATRPDRHEQANGFNNLDELKPYERNLKAIIANARLNNMQPVLLSMPTCTDAAVAHQWGRKSIEQCNVIHRNIAASDSGLVFVDLDALMSGTDNELFEDLGHLNEQGRALKARYVANVLVDHEQALSLATNQP